MLRFRSKFNLQGKHIFSDCTLSVRVNTCTVLCLFIVHFVHILLYTQSKRNISVLLYVFFWVIPRRLNSICQRFGTLCLFHLHRQVGVEWINLRIVGVYTCIREKVWLEPNLFPYTYPNISRTYSFYTYLPMKMEQTKCSETSAYKIQTPGNYPEESIQHSEHGESLKSRSVLLLVE